MSLSDADSSLPLSALQHWLFCPRQCALIHVERVWAENQFTAEGRVLHERADEVQLCAQGLCLEEMTGQPVPEGALFYGAARRRKTVPLDAGLRDLTLTMACEARTAISAGALPKPVFETRRCGSCSMLELCRPNGRRDLGMSWMTDRITRAGIPE